ncbi:MAG: type VI secretion system baseplate subunit TssG [Thiobacillus sp.]|nr:type VI secretion system baseplate subunit TssG [Thiobacillus sp.]
MPTPQRPSRISVIDSLISDPYRFEFFQAVRVLEKSFINKGIKTGLAGERICFRNSLTLSFPPSEIELFTCHGARAPAAISPDDEQFDGGQTGDDVRYEITPTFIGLTGPMGAMPRHYTEKLIEREILYRDRAARAFLDVFSNRMVAMFYEAWKKYRLPVQYEQDKKNRFTPLLLALTGCNQDQVRSTLQDGNKDIFDESIAHYAGILRQRPMSAWNVRNVLADYFHTPIEIEQFVGRWFTIPDDQRTTLSGAYADLGVSTFCGERVWQRQTRLRILIGPMSRQKFLSFLPYGKAARSLARLLALSLGQSFEYEVRLLLRKDEIFPAQLGNTEQPARLGWDTFLQTHAANQDSDDAMYEVEATAA